MEKEKDYEEIKSRFTLVSYSQEIHDILKQYNPNQQLTETQKAFHKIQHDLNPLHVMGRLMRAGVPKEILNKIIPQYEKAITPIIYPLIKK